MFAHDSRYSALERLKFMAPGGRQITYVARRIVPQPENLNAVLQVRLKPGDRLDLVAWATLGAPELFWQICDANSALNPFDLTTRTGAMIKVPIPGPQSI
jgi:hypothetical protein